MLFLGSAASLPLHSHRPPCSQASGTRVLNHTLHHDVWGGGDFSDDLEPSMCGASGALKQLFATHGPDRRRWSKDPIV